MAYKDDDNGIVSTARKPSGSRQEPVVRPFFCVYAEGIYTRDNDGYTVEEMGGTDVNKFETLAEMNEWIENRELDQETSPPDKFGDTYVFQWQYKGKEEWGTEA